MYIYAALGGVIAVSAESADIGKVLWKTTAWNHSVIAPSPLAIGDDRILLTAGYSAGSMVIKISQKADRFKVTVLQKIKPSQGIACEQQTPIFINNRIYSILPKDAGDFRKQFVCAKPEDITKIIWNSGKTNRYGLGPFIYADNKFYILSDDGILTMIKADVDQFEILGKAKVLNGRDAWGPIALAGTKMLLRDSKEMVCIEIGILK